MIFVEKTINYVKSLHRRFNFNKKILCKKKIGMFIIMKIFVGFVKEDLNMKTRNLII